MKLKTYRAASMADALSAVKKDLGRNAIILHTRQVKTGGVLGFRRRTMIEITASDEQPRAGKKVGRGTLETVKPQPKPRDVGAPSSPGVAAEPLIASLAAHAYKRAASAGPAARVELSSSAAAGAAPKAPAPVIIPAPGVGTPAALPAREQRAMPAAAAPASESAGSDAPASVGMPVVMKVRQRRTGSEPESPAGGERPRAIEASVGAQNVAAGDGRLLAELADIKLLVNQVLQSAPAQAPGGAAGAMPEALFKQYLRLLEAAVSREIADGIIGAVRDELSPAELSDESIVRATILRHLAGLIPVAEQTTRSSTPGDGRPITIALVGPTGVGKTTTIAKLAAAYKLRQGKSVGLITSDTYRIAAVDQLRTYASILGVPLKVVMTPGEMDAAVRSFGNFDVVLVDTAGRSQHASERLQELAAFLDAASPHETHLVLSSTASEGVLVQAAERFIAAGIRPNRLILSKLDEAVNFGVVVNVARKISAKLSFITTGQEVPDHLEPGRPDRLARMILDNAIGPIGPVGTPGANGRVPAPGASVDLERAELLGIGEGIGMGIGGAA